MCCTNLQIIHRAIRAFVAFEYLYQDYQDTFFLKQQTIKSLAIECVAGTLRIILHTTRAFVAFEYLRSELSGL